MPTPEELVKNLLKTWNFTQDNKDRLENYALYEKYYDGDFEIDLPARIKEALSTDFKVISNYAKTVVNKAVGYLCSEPITIEVKPDLFGLDGGETDEQKKQNEEQRKRIKAAAKEGERLLYQVYRANNFLQKNIIKLIRLQGKKGDVFVKCWLDRNDKENPIKMAVIKPDIVFIKFSQDDYEKYEYVALIYTKYDEQNNAYKFAQVWWKDVWVEYEDRGSDWKEIKRGTNEIGIIPIVHIKNMEDEKPWGESDIEVIKTLVDASCKTLTDLMVNADYQAFQRVIVSGYDEPVAIPGQPKKKTQTGPGTITYIPSGDNAQNPEVTVVEPANPEGLIKIIDALAQEIATHARVPKISLSRVDGAGAASSLSLRIHYQPLDEKCNEKATLAANGLQEINRIIFAYHKLLNREDFTTFETEVGFSKSLPADKKEEQEIRDSKIRNKTMSKETAMEEEGIDDVEAEKERIQAETEEEQQDLYNKRLDSDINSLLGTGNKG